MVRALKDEMPERHRGNPVNSGGGGGGGGSSGTCRSEAVRVESLRWSKNHPLMMGYQYCRHYMQTHSTQLPLTQHGTPTPLCSSQHHSLDSQGQQESTSFHALPGMLQRNQRPLADTPRNCSPASPDQGEDEDLSGMVAEQLRIIGDEMNDIYEQRRNEAQDWHHWRGLWRGLYSFITETVTVGYLHGLR